MPKVVEETGVRIRTLPPDQPPAVNMTGLPPLPCSSERGFRRGWRHEWKVVQEPGGSPPLGYLLMGSGLHVGKAEGRTIQTRAV